MIILSLWYGVLRLIPYFHSSVPTGYDAGIYLAIFNLDGVVPTWLAGSYYTALFYMIMPIARLFTDPSLLIIPLQIVAALFLFAALSWSTKSFMNREQRLFTLFLYSISAIQFRMFWFYYVKNMIAFGFVLLFLGACYRKKYLVATLLAILVGLIHLPTFFVLMSICAVEFVMHSHKKQIFIMSAISLGVTLLYNLPVFEITILPFVKPFLELNRIVQPLATPSWGGTFYGLLTSLLLMSFYLWIPIVYFFKNRQELTTFMKTPYFSALLATSIIVLGQFFFFRRFIPAWDLFVIIAAGYSVKQIVQMKYLYPIVSVIFIIIFVIRTGMPLKNSSDISELRSLTSLTNSYILSTSKEDTAWIMGYTDARVMAWDFGGYSTLLTQSEWEAFYSSRTREEFSVFFEKLPRPMYVYVSNKEADRFSPLTSSGLLEQVSPQVWKVR